MAKKQRAVKTVNVKDAAFVYTSICCTAAATKPACALAGTDRVGTYLGAVPDTDTRNLTLGTWRCSTCRKPCKVTRTVNKEQAPRQVV